MPWWIVEEWLEGQVSFIIHSNWLFTGCRGCWTPLGPTEAQRSGQPGQGKERGRAVTDPQHCPEPKLQLPAHSHLLDRKKQQLVELLHPTDQTQIMSFMNDTNSSRWDRWLDCRWLPDLLNKQPPEPLSHKHRVTRSPPQQSVNNTENILKLAW